MRINPRVRTLDWIGIDAISPSLQKAVIESEDRRFYQHHGVDWRAIGGAALRSLPFSRPRGGSTITMQLAALLDKTLRPRNGQRSLGQKWRQIQEAEKIEKEWTKVQILEAYLNMIYFRGELQGIGAASRGLFGKEPHGLDEPESLMLAVLIRAPNANVEKVAARACQLGLQMQIAVGCEAIRQRTEEALSHPPLIQPHQSFAPHAAQRLLRPRSQSDPRPASKQEISIASTLDGALQRFAVETLRRQLAAIRSQNVADGAVLVVENKTGQVFAYVGNSGEGASFQYVDGIQARRQAGSTLKPFLYALALERRLLTPASIIDDSPLDIPLENGIYHPQNYDHAFAGPVSVRTALASSLNVPAVKMLGWVGLAPFLETLRDFGFQGLDEEDGFYGPSLALGSADVTLWELVQAYRALADGGIWRPLTLSAAETSRPTRPALSKEAAFIISDILSDREARSQTFGLESPLSTRYWSAVKTGTSKEMRDNWCIGYSERYTVGVWVGNFSGSPMWNVSGITGAAPIWLEIMNRLHADQPSRPAKPPKGIVSNVISGSPFQPHRREWFFRGTEPIAFDQNISLKEEKIVYPVSGTIFTLDPDIPPVHQKLIFQAEQRNRSLRWRLNGDDLGPAGGLLAWPPERGKYELSLVAEENRVIDSVQFEVRGALKD
jgi:penicillin-binding protein 1C